MKELSIEEKAKRYDEALEKAKELLKDPFEKPNLEYIFPELKESEDEKIRKSLIILLQYFCKGYRVPGLNFPVSYTEMLAWLEKQGKNNMGISEDTKQKLKDNLNKALEKETPESFNEFLDEQNPTEHKEIPTDIRSIVDKEANAIWEEINTGHNHSIIDTFNQFYGMCMQVAEAVMEYNKPAEWSEEDEAIYYGVIETEQYMLDVVNGIKKFDVGNVSIKEDCTRELDWLQSLKDRVQPQSKQEWNEEDKNMLQSILDEYKSMPIEKRNWLKSLRPQPQWKPNDEQMDALETAVSSLQSTALESLYQKLNKLIKSI